MFKKDLIPFDLSNHAEKIEQFWKVKTGVKSVEKRIENKNHLVESLQNTTKGITLRKGLSTKILSKTLAKNFNEEFN